MPDAPAAPDPLQSWVAAVRSALDLPQVDTGALLDLARDVAHGVARPAAPLTCFLVGFAAGRAAAAGTEPQAAVAAAADVVGELLTPDGAG